jgi:hypothetical protein
VAAPASSARRFEVAAALRRTGDACLALIWGSDPDDRMCAPGRRLPAFLVRPDRLTSPSTARDIAFARLLLTSLVLLTLSACSSGNAREAEQGRDADASEEARLADLQATYSAGFVDPGTPDASPTADARFPTLDRLVLTSNLAGNGPTEELASVPANYGTVYAGALLNGLRRGMVVSALWRNERGDVYRSETTIERAADQAWVGLPLPLDGSLAPGNYAVILFVAVADEDPVALNSLVFEITSSGTQARSLAPGRTSRGNDSGGGGDSGGSGDSPTIVPIDD